jgi:aryl-alcohol dehydrogenase-like predicted oxidoreductase
MGVGTWAWGDRLFWRYGKTYRDEDIREAFEVSVKAGVQFFDTAEMYGLGHSERLLGALLRENKYRAVVASKFFPFPWRVTKGALHHALRGSLKRLERERVDLYLAHWPFPPRPVTFWMEAMAEAVKEGLIRAVGVSNYSVEQMKRSHQVLAAHSIPLACNQVECSLLNRRVERNGLLTACREMGVTLVAYSPLAMGVLTGKYSPDHPPAGVRALLYPPKKLKACMPLIETMKEVGAAHGGKTPAQVALNWLICKGAVPIPGAKNAQQARSNAGALGWRLTADEVAALDATSDRIDH